MKSYTLILLILLTGCGQMPVGYSSLSKSSDTQYIRDVHGTIQYRISEGSVFTPNGTRVARIDSLGNVYNITGSRVARIGKK